MLKKIALIVLALGHHRGGRVLSGGETIDDDNDYRAGGRHQRAGSHHRQGMDDETAANRPH